MLDALVIGPAYIRGQGLMRPQTVSHVHTSKEFLVI